MKKFNILKMLIVFICLYSSHGQAMDFPDENKTKFMKRKGQKTMGIPDAKPTNFKCKKAQALCQKKDVRKAITLAIAARNSRVQFNPKDFWLTLEDIQLYNGQARVCYAVNTYNPETSSGEIVLFPGVGSPKLLASQDNYPGCICDNRNKKRRPASLAHLFYEYIIDNNQHSYFLFEKFYFSQQNLTKSQRNLLFFISFNYFREDFVNRCAGGLEVFNKHGKLIN